MEDLLKRELNKLGKLIHATNAAAGTGDENLDFSESILTSIRTPMEAVDILEIYYNEVKTINKQYKKVADIFEQCFRKDKEENDERV